jgi:hypothetical protein
MSKKTNHIGSESQDVVNCPERSRLRLIAVLLSSLLLGGAQAQCSFMSGDQRDEDKDNKDEQNKKTGAPANPA